MSDGLAPLRWGIMSTASILKHVIPALRCLPEGHATVAAIASRTQESAEKCAKQYSVATAIGSYEALLADPAIDIIYLPLPPNLHREWVIKALAAGKHVLCEKPLALNPEDVRAMYAAAKAHRRVLMEAFMSLHTAQHSAVQTLVASGSGSWRLGQLVHISAKFAYPLSRQGFRESAAGDGGGSLWDVGCYCVGFAQSVVGCTVAPNPDAITAIAHRTVAPHNDSGETRCGQKGADMLLSGVVTYTNGASLAVECGLVGPLRVSGEITGTTGRIVLATPFKPDPTGAAIVTLVGPDGAVAKVIEVRETSHLSAGGSPHLYRGEIERFHKLVRSCNAKGAEWTAALEADAAFSENVAATVNALHQKSIDVPWPAANL